MIYHLFQSFSYDVVDDFVDKKRSAVDLRCAILSIPMRQ